MNSKGKKNSQFPTVRKEQPEPSRSRWANLLSQLLRASEPTGVAIFPCPPADATNLTLFRCRPMLSCRRYHPYLIRAADPTPTRPYRSGQSPYPSSLQGKEGGKGMSLFSGIDYESVWMLPNLSKP
jgi:hypothetical protein